MHINSGDIMYYINSFFIYSILGFILESTIYKFNDSNRHSGIFFGPITPIYGIGVLIILFIYILVNNLKIHKYLKIILLFIFSIIILSLIEFIGGNLIHIIFNIDLWDYSNHKFRIGKYNSLFISLSWGLLSIIFIYIIKPIMDKLINNIPKFITYIFIILFLIDFMSILIFKKL